MKKHLLLLFALSVQLAQAQNDITTLAAFSTSSTSTVPLKYLSTSSQPAISAGNQNWDFSGLSYSDNASEMIKGAASTTNGSLFPSANIMRNDYLYGNMYYDWTTTSKSLYGYYYNADYNEMYSNPANLYSLPLTYNVSKNDTYAYTKHLGASSTSACTGTSTTIYDGYGSLKTNNGTFADVVRLKISSIEQDTEQQSSEVTTVTTNSYLWFSSTGALLLIISDQKIQNSTVTLNSRSVYSYGTAIITGLFENKAAQALTASPNPATDVIKLNFESVPSGAYQMTITNKLGIQLQKETILVNEGDQYPIYLSSLTSGMYMLRLSSGTEQRVLKFIKE
jgi:hypothetical protein